ncbi:hypothetical protein IWQ61_007355, partial [Dispira simplex]
DTIQRVCRQWFRLVNSERAWKLAFLRHFSNQRPYQRLAIESWRTEYFCRVALLRHWSGHRARKVTLDPRLGSLSAVMVDLSVPWVLLGSIEQGIVVCGDPVAGTIQRNTPYFAYNGDFPAPVSVVAITAQRIVWGFPDGSLKSLGLHHQHRQLHWKTFPGAHTSAVTQIVWPTIESDSWSRPDHFLSVAAQTQCVKLWDVKKGQCEATFRLPVDDSPTTAAYVPHRWVMVGTRTGNVHVWSKPSPSVIISPNSRRDQTASLPSSPHAISEPKETHTILAVGEERTNTAVMRLGLSGAEYHPLAVVELDQSPWLRVISMAWNQPLAQLPASITVPVTCVHWRLFVFQPRLASSLPQNFVQTDFRSPGVPEERRLIAVTGHLDGSVRLWSQDVPNSNSVSGSRAQSTSNQPQVPNVPENFVLVHAFHPYSVPVTHVYVDEYKMVTTSWNGSVDAWDALTQRHLRTFSARQPRRRQHPHPPHHGGDARRADPPLRANGRTPLETSDLDAYRWRVSRILTAIWKMHTPGRTSDDDVRYTLSGPLPMQGPLTEWIAESHDAPMVTSLHVQSEGVTAVVDKALLHWNMSKEQPLSHTGKKQVNLTGGSRLEISQELQEGLADYHKERVEELELQRHRTELEQLHSIQGLTEEEQVRYAMLLSADQNQRPTHSSISENVHQTSDKPGSTGSSPKNQKGKASQVLIDHQGDADASSYNAIPGSSRPLPTPTIHPTREFPEGSHLLGDLSEKELLEYVLMLSKEEQ